VLYGSCGTRGSSRYHNTHLGLHHQFSYFVSCCTEEGKGVGLEGRKCGVHNEKSYLLIKKRMGYSVYTSSLSFYCYLYNAYNHHIIQEKLYIRSSTGLKTLFINPLLSLRKLDTLKERSTNFRGKGLKKLFVRSGSNNLHSLQCNSCITGSHKATIFALKSVFCNTNRINSTGNQRTSSLPTTCVSRPHSLSPSNPL